MGYLNAENYDRLLNALIYARLKEDFVGLSRDEIRDLVIGEYGPSSGEYLARWLGSNLRRKLLGQRDGKIYIVSVRAAMPVEDIKTGDYL